MLVASAPYLCRRKSVLVIHVVLEGDAAAKYPLQAASYSVCDADLGSEDWTKRLIAAGFDPSVPTVWIAEGLLVYLSEAVVTALLENARSVSAKRSRFLMMVRT